MNHKLTTHVIVAMVTLLGFFTPIMAVAADEPKAPATVKELFADFDARKEYLDFIATKCFPKTVK